ncbi:filamentous hemagglutinin family domain-containing protein [Lentinula edodes]|uniref:Filamentous hemagglutinin family domain-containing protein n=1 Tax=Lentinula edodes TaxID=5353 RepID=A0A1Q3E7N5_LENED|nr:filamentous hemagglutinin family domain-containing protein [Lentinula edodes]
MADLSLSVTQLQALHTLLLLQGSNLPDDLKSLPASLQAQLALNFSAPSFPTPSPSPEKLPRTGSISLARARLRPPWLFSQPRATCEVGTQVEDPALALESFSRPSSPASSAGYGAGSEVEEDLGGDSAPNLAHGSAPNLTHHRTPNRTPNRTHDCTPNRTHDRTPNRTHDRTPDRTPNRTPNRPPNRPHDFAPNRTHDFAPNRTHDFAPNRARNFAPNCAHNSTPNWAHDSTPNPAYDSTPNCARNPFHASDPDSIYDDAHGTPSCDPGCSSIREAAHRSAQDTGCNSAHSSSQEAAREAAYDCRGHVSTPSRSHISDRESSYEHPLNSSQASVYSSTHARYLCDSQDTAQDPALKSNEAFPNDQGKAEEGLLLANTIFPSPSEADDESLLDHDTLLADSHQQDADDPNPLLDELLEELLNDNRHYQEKMILCSDLDAAILSLLEDEGSRPLVNSPTHQTGFSPSHFATSNEDPGSRKRRRLRDSLGEEVQVEVVEPRVAQANPFDPRPDCNRNGASTSRKRPRVNHLLNLDFGEEEEQLGGEEENTGPQFLYEASDRPHAPPKEVTDASLGLMLRLTGGAGWGTDVWAEDIRRIVACVDWEEASGALSSYSLLHLAQRCSRAEKIDTGATFIRMIYELFLAAKVNRASFNLDRQQEIWEPILSFLPEEGEDPISFNELGTRYLTQSSGFEDFEALELGLESDSDYLKKVEEFSTLENQFASTYVGNSEEGTILQLKSWFREDSIPKSNPFPAKISSRKTWTEEKRAAASKAISPENLEELAEKLMDRYDKVSGKIRKNQKWLKVPQHLIAG